jgi:hypothetical protein
VGGEKRGDCREDGDQGMAVSLDGGLREHRAGGWAGQLQQLRSTGQGWQHWPEAYRAHHKRTRKQGSKRAQGPAAGETAGDVGGGPSGNGQGTSRAAVNFLPSPFPFPVCTCLLDVVHVADLIHPPALQEVKQEGRDRGQRWGMLGRLG